MPAENRRRSGASTDLRVTEPESYPPVFDVDIVKAIHWCRLGRVRPEDDGAFHRAKAMGLLAQDDVWRATPQGEGVLIALGLLEGKPSQLSERRCNAMEEALRDLIDRQHDYPTDLSWARGWRLAFDRAREAFGVR